jgi:hypothetical protein
MFTSANSVYIGQCYADPDKNKEIDQPHACLYGTTVRKSLYEGLSSDSLTDGFLSRMLIFESADDDPEAREDVETIEPPKGLVEIARYWGQFNSDGNMSDLHPIPVVVPYVGESRAIINELERLSRRERAGADETIATLWTRTTEKARKLALLAACSIDHREPQVDGAAAQWAADLSEHLTRRMLSLAGEWIAENPFEQRRKRVLRAVREAGGVMTRSELMRATRWATNRERGELIESLQATGELIEESATATGAGRPKIVYRAAAGG